MIDIQREKMFPDNVFVMDHLVPNVDWSKDKDKLQQIYTEKLQSARKSNMYDTYVFYPATDGWHDLFDDFLQKNDIIAITGNYNHSSRWKWFPHWQVVVDSTPPLLTTKTLPNYRWQYWVRRPRPHRIELLSEIAKLDIPVGDIIFPEHLIEPTGRTFPPTEELFADKDLYKKISKQFNPPIDIPLGANGAYVASYHTRQDRAIDVVTETMTNIDGSVFVSEKTFKAIRAGQMFFVLGQPNTIKALKDYGFKTFDKWIDHSYDDEEDMPKRAALIAKELHRISNLPQQDFEKMWIDSYEDRVFNQNYNRYDLNHWKKYLLSLLSC